MKSSLTGPFYRITGALSLFSGNHDLDTKYAIETQSFIYLVNRAINCTSWN